jgi:hypothetical protein
MKGLDKAVTSNTGSRYFYLVETSAHLTSLDTARAALPPTQFSPSAGGGSPDRAGNQRSVEKSGRCRLLFHTPSTLNGKQPT